MQLYFCNATVLTQLMRNTATTANMPWKVGLGFLPGALSIALGLLKQVANLFFF
jgi:hypothetical protein